jgi:hypothetical protein
MPSKAGRLLSQPRPTRVPFRGPTWLSLGAVLLCSLPAWAQAIDVDVRGLSCPKPSRIAGDIRRLLAASVPTGRHLAVVLEGSGQGRISLRLKMSLAGDHARSSQPGGGSAQPPAETRALDRWIALQREDCEVLAHTVAFIVDPWLRQDWSEMKRVVPPQPGSSAPKAPRSPLRNPDGEAGTASSTTRKEGSVRFLAAADAGAFTSLSSDFRAGMRLAISAEYLPSEHRGLFLGLRYDSPVSRSSRGGSIAASMLAASVRLRFASWVAWSWTFDLLAGPGVQIVFVTSREYARNDTIHLASVALEAALRGRRPLGRQLFFLIALGAELRSHEDVLEIRNIGAVLRLPPGRVALTTGLAWGAQ